MSRGRVSLLEWLRYEGGKGYTRQAEQFTNLMALNEPARPLYNVPGFDPNPVKLLSCRRANRVQSVGGFVEYRCLEIHIDLLFHCRAIPATRFDPVASDLFSIARQFVNYRSDVGNTADWQMKSKRWEIFKRLWEMLECENEEIFQTQVRRACFNICCVKVSLTKILLFF